MPSDFPRRPKLLKGALVAYESQFLGPIPNVIVFQYNPDQLSRTLTQRSPIPEPSNQGAAKDDTYRAQGAPVETINLTVALDATDQLEEPATHPHVVNHGLHPALAALELLLYPASAQILAYRIAAQANRQQIAPPDTRLVLFIWGPSRVLPVKLTSFSVTEEAFDQKLNPIRAKVVLGMRVLSYMELKKNSIGSNAYLASQAQKEVLARLNLINSAQNIISMLPF